MPSDDIVPPFDSRKPPCNCPSADACQGTAFHRATHTCKLEVARQTGTPPSLRPRYAPGTNCGCTSASGCAQARSGPGPLDCRLEEGKPFADGVEPGEATGDGPIDDEVEEAWAGDELAPIHERAEELAAAAEDDGFIESASIVLRDGMTVDGIPAVRILPSPGLSLTQRIGLLQSALHMELLNLRKL